MFTESASGIPPRARVTPRAKSLLADAVLDGDRSVSAVAGDYGCAWHTVHDHLIVVADAALGDEPEPVLVLGIDETRRGKAMGNRSGHRCAVVGGPVGHRTGRFDRRSSDRRSCCF